jgi:hypothetical protein
MDCSAHGLGLEDSGPMEMGQEFAVYLKLDEVAMVLYRVCHCTQVTPGRYKIGARLAGFLDRREENPDRVLASLLEERLV